jgi:hypothetical protein
MASIKKHFNERSKRFSSGQQPITLKPLLINNGLTFAFDISFQLFDDLFFMFDDGLDNISD